MRSSKMSDSSSTCRVLIIGASGVFGCRLAERAAIEPSLTLTLAGRRGDALARVAERIGGPVGIVALDRDTLTASDLAPFDIVVDAAGPFQASATSVISAAIAARVDYIDLADARGWVRDIARFNSAARAAGVSVVTGASSSPALSHAVIDRTVACWRSIETIRIGIFPGNRTPRGRAVVEAILSYVGKPVRVFRNGHWSEQPGWSGTHRVAINGLGTRWASICDTPEQDLLVARYRPTRSAEFFAGIELSILHLGLAALALPVRWGWLTSLRPYAGILLWLAQRLISFGSDCGGMVVEVCGINAAGVRVQARWTLHADANRGPYVPTLAALAMIRRRRDGNRPDPGARACSGILRLDEFEADFASLGIVTTGRTVPVCEARPVWRDTMVKLSEETD